MSRTPVPGTPSGLDVAHRPHYVVAAAVAEVQTFAALLEMARASIPAAGDEAGQAIFTIANLSAGAQDLLLGNPASGLGSQTLSAVIFGAVGLVADSAIEPSDAMREFDALAAALPMPAPPSTFLGTSADVITSNAAVLRLAEAAAVVSQMGVLAGRIAYGNRGQASADRDRLARRFNDLIDVTFDGDVLSALVSARGAAIDYLSRAVLDLAPVITVEAPRSMPALYWAHRLYGDASRAGELVDRNRVSHPAYMPPRFEALGR